MTVRPKRATIPLSLHASTIYGYGSSNQHCSSKISRIQRYWAVLRDGFSGNAVQNLVRWFGKKATTPSEMLRVLTPTSQISFEEPRPGHIFSLKATLAPKRLQAPGFPVTLISIIDILLGQKKHHYYLNLVQPAAFRTSVGWFALTR